MRTMKFLFIHFFVFGLQFVGCLNEDTEINLENGGDGKQALVAMPQEVEENIISPDINFKVDKKIFQPSHEWKTIEPDEIIPPGLHVRMNLQTGLREAKLLKEEKDVYAKKDREETLSSTLKALIEDSLLELKNEQDGIQVPDIENLSQPVKHDDNLLKKAELKRILKKFKGDKVHEQELKEQSKTNLRNMDQLKKEFQDLNVDVKLDSEILKELLSRYNSTDLSEQEKLDILDSLEYYLHQIDNANLFVDVGGLSLLSRDLNGTSQDLQSSSLLVLAAAVQSNPHSQVAALKEGFLELCLRVMMSATSPKVRALGIHALSATIRNFPFAQKKFGDIGGIDFIMELLKSGSVGDKVAIKVISMVSDLLEEQEYTRKDEYMSENLKKEKLNQYSMVQLVERVMKTDWCQLLLQFLTIDDLNLSESVLNAMSSWFKTCHSHFPDSLSKLNDFAVDLKNLQGTEEQHEYFNELAAKVKEMSQKIVKAKIEL